VAGQTVEVALSDPGPSATFPIPADIVPFVDSVYAEIDNSAGSDTVPTLEVRGPNGDTVAAVPQSDTLPGGDTGRATWALRLAAKAAAATATSLPCCFLDTNTPFTLAPWGGTYSFISWELISTNDASVFSWPYAANNAVVGIAKPGVYRLVYEYRTSGLNFPAAPGTIISQPFVSAGVFGSTSEVPSVNATTGALYRGDQTTGLPYGPISERLFNLTVPGYAAVDIAWQAAAGSATIESAVCFIYRLGDPVL
jgi:hypothetical protein